MPSFDIVSELDHHELQNAVENANREISSRFDFRDADASFELKNTVVTAKAEGDFQLKQMVDILREKLNKRNIDPNMMELKDIDHTGKTYTQNIQMKEGIETSLGKKIVKTIKDKKLKVQASIQGEQIRVSGKKRDDLQSVIQLIKESDFNQPFQFINFRD